MRALLNALQDGRLIELPGTDKDGSLKVLANLIDNASKYAAAGGRAEHIAELDAGEGFDGHRGRLGGAGRSCGPALPLPNSDAIMRSAAF